MNKIGTREEVYNGIAQMTKGKLKKEDLILNRKGKIVSKKMSENAMRNFAKLRSKRLASTPEQDAALSPIQEQDTK